MKRIELRDTTAFRLSMLFSGLFALLAVGVFALVYWLNATFVQAQTAQRLESETQALLEHYQEFGIDGLVEAVRVRSSVAGLVNLHYMIVDGNGLYVAGNLLEWPDDVAMSHGTARFERSVHLPSPGAFDWDQDEYYEVAAHIVELTDGHRLLIGIGLYEFTELSEQSLAGLLVGSAVTIVLALLVGTVLGRIMLSRVNGLDSALADIMRGDLGRRLNPSRRHDEYARLAERINRMLDRIEELVDSLRRVTSNVSHDLRTPLHRLRGRLEQLLLRAELPDQRARDIESAIVDIDEILTTFTDLLSIAEAEAGLHSATFEDVDVSELTETVADLYAAAAEERDLRFDCTVHPGIRTRGKSNLLSQALSNLLENAIKFTPPGGTVRVQLVACENGFEVSVADTGPGIPAADRERVLQPFERLDAARSAPGSGLGLSVVSAIAALHGAELRLADNAPGLRVSLRFHYAEGRTGQRAS